MQTQHILYNAMQEHRRLDLNIVQPFLIGSTLFKCIDCLSCVVVEDDYDWPSLGCPSCDSLHSRDKDND
jgi:hypothetical protein